MPAGARRARHHVAAQSQSDRATAAYVALARTHGLDPAQMALPRCLSRPFMTSVIIGATSMDQLRANIGAARMTLPAEVMAEIERSTANTRARSENPATAKRTK